VDSLGERAEYYSIQPPFVSFVSLWFTFLSAPSFRCGRKILGRLRKPHDFREPACLAVSREVRRKGKAPRANRSGAIEGRSRAAWLTGPLRSIPASLWRRRSIRYFFFFPPAFFEAFFAGFLAAFFVFAM
jgi:hypothetical protein